MYIYLNTSRLHYPINWLTGTRRSRSSQPQTSINPQTSPALTPSDRNHLLASVSYPTYPSSLIPSSREIGMKVDYVWKNGWGTVFQFYIHGYWKQLGTMEIILDFLNISWKGILGLTLCLEKNWQRYSCFSACNYFVGFYF